MTFKFGASVPGVLVNHQKSQSLQLAMPGEEHNLAIHLAQLEEVCQADCIHKRDELPLAQV